MPAHKIEGPDQLKSLVGKEAGMSDWFEITQARINQFADATEDHQWIHIDEARATNESPYRSTIAHGFLTLSLLPMMLQQAVELTGFDVAAAAAGIGVFGHGISFRAELTTR